MFKSLEKTALFSQYGLYRGLIFIAIGFSLTMALLSPTEKQVHCDEYDHFNAAKFYFHNWLPPEVGDQKALNSYSLYGMSYLNEWDVVYLLAGKFAMLIHPLVGNDEVALRIFNVSLFFILGCIALYHRNSILAFAILLTSSQIWYIFSYFNGDAFPFFVAMLIVHNLTQSSSLFNSYARPTVIRYLPLGIYIGLLIISKKTFWAFGIFAIIYAIWLEISRPDSKATLARLQITGILITIILAVISPRIGYDLYINGTPSEKANRILETAETLAAPAFKPSSHTRLEIDIKSKGVTITEMFTKLHWGHDSISSSFGSYNYGAIGSDNKPIVMIYILFVAYMFVATLIYGNISQKIILAFGFIFSCLIFCLSLYHSWAHDFQPQGRYLFGIFCILSIILTQNKELFKPVVINLFLFSCFALSSYSFAYALSKTPEFKDVSEINHDFIRK